MRSSDAGRRAAQGLQHTPGPGRASAPLAEAIAAAARAVVHDQRSLRQALRQQRSRLPRQSDLLACWQALPAAVREEQALFQHPRYAQRLQQTATTLALAARLLAPWSPQAAGPAALGLAADDDEVEMLIYHDEEEALLRWLMDREWSFRSGEWSPSRQPDQGARRCATVTLGAGLLRHAAAAMRARSALRGEVQAADGETPGTDAAELLDLRLGLLPLAWRGRPLYVDGLPWPLSAAP